MRANAKRVSVSRYLAIFSAFLALGALLSCSTFSKKDGNYAKSTYQTGAKRTPADGGPHFKPRPGQFHGHSDIDPGTIGHDPGDMRFCLDRRQMFDKENRPIAPQLMEACAIGVELGRSFAGDYAGGWGRVHGYLRGYSYEMWNGADQFGTDPAALAAGTTVGQSVAQYNQNLALQSGGAAGYSYGQTGGRSDAISRFEAAVDRATSVSDQYTVPAPSYAGITAGCQLADQVVIPDSLMTGEDYQIHSSRMVCEMPSRQDILNKGYVTYPELEIYQYTDVMNMSEMAHLRAPDLWSNDGTQTFDMSVWQNNQRAYRAFDRFYAHPRKYAYDRLGTVVWNEDPPAPPADAAPDPRAPKPETAPKPGAQDYDLQNRPASIVHRVDLKDVARDAFSNAYDYYKNFNYAKEYNDYLPYGRAQGFDVGQDIGQSYAFHSARAKAFSESFANIAAGEYRGKFKEGYDTSFHQWYTEYATKPQLTILSFDSVNGKDEDGILQAGETISAQFTMKNAGAVNGPLNVTVSGNVTDTKALNFVSDRLRTKQVNADAIAKIDGSLGENAQAQIVLHVNNMMRERDETVHKPVVMNAFEITGLDVVQGSGTLRTSLHNNMNKATGTDVCAKMLVAGQEIAPCQFVHAIGGNQDAVVTLPFSGLDPLALIDGKTFTARAEWYTAGVLVGAAEAVIQSSGDPIGLTFDYFHKLLADGNPTDRLHQVEGRVVLLNRREVDANKSDGSNVWKDNQDGTIVGRVIRMVEGSTLSQGMKAEMWGMTQQMWTEHSKLAKIVFVPGPKRANYERLCQKLAQLLGHNPKELK